MTMPNTEMTMSETQGMTLMKPSETGAPRRFAAEPPEAAPAAQGMTLMKQPEAGRA
jgi:hypothetical protein